MFSDIPPPGLNQVAAFLASFGLGFLCKTYGRQAVNVVRRVNNPTDTKLVLVVRTDLRMSPGKMASQCSHAAVSCYKTALEANPRLVAAWEAQGQPKIVLRASESGERGLTALAKSAASHGLTTIIIRDAGRTEVTRGSATVLGIGPGDSQAISNITSSYRLY